jgi:hypothetical protein
MEVYRLCRSVMLRSSLCAIENAPGRFVNSSSLFRVDYLKSPKAPVADLRSPNEKGATLVSYFELEVSETSNITQYRTEWNCRNCEMH